nr:protein 10419 [Theama mediterranea]
MILNRKIFRTVTTAIFFVIIALCVFGTTSPVPCSGGGGEGAEDGPVPGERSQQFGGTEYMKVCFYKKELIKLCSQHSILEVQDGCRPCKCVTHGHSRKPCCSHAEDHARNCSDPFTDKTAYERYCDNVRRKYAVKSLKDLH